MNENIEIQLEPVKFETAKKLKQIGFDLKCKKLYNLLGELWDCHYSYTTNQDIDSGGLCTAPLQATVLLWFRKTHNIHISGNCSYMGWYWNIEITNGNQTPYNHEEEFQYFKTCELAVEQGILKYCDIVFAELNELYKENEKNESTNNQ